MLFVMPVGCSQSICYLLISPPSARLRSHSYWRIVEIQQNLVPEKKDSSDIMMGRRIGSTLIIVVAAAGVVSLSFFAMLRALDYWDDVSKSKGKVMEGSATGEARSAAVPSSNVGALRIGDRVKRGGGKTWIDVNGQPILLATNPPGSSKLVGAVEAAQPGLMGQTVLQGWAIDTGAKLPALQVVAIMQDRIMASAAPSSPRTDIAAGIGPSYRDAGFSLAIQNISQAEFKDLRVYAVMRDNNATELNYASQLPNAAR
jgi:hypothetical protein